MASRSAPRCRRQTSCRTPADAWLPLPSFSGHLGGHETDLRRIGLDGVVLLGRLEGIDGARVHLGPDLHDVLDLDAVRVSTVIWSGYVQDYSWIEPPITGEMGFLRQHRGLTGVPGLSVIGSLWQHHQTSFSLVGLQRDARDLAAQLGLGR